MIEFAVVGPLLTLIGTLVLQYATLFNAKNLINHASFMAARSGSMANARMSDIQTGYLRALVPLYKGGLNGEELAQAYASAAQDMAGNLRVEILNPTKESFDDWNDPTLQKKYGARAIPNGGLAFKNPAEIKSNSGQNLQDANLIKLKITHGYELKVPLAGTALQFMMKWMDNGKDPFVTALYNNRRIPLVSHVTLQMHSDPVEPTNPVSVPGLGNNGDATDPGFAEDPVKEPPRCITAGCTVIVDPTVPPGGSDPPLQGCPPGSVQCTPLCEAGG